MKFNKKQQINNCLLGIIALLGVGTVQAKVLERGFCPYLTKATEAKGEAEAAVASKQYNFQWRVIKEGTVNDPGAPISDLYTTYGTLHLKSDMFFKDATKENAYGSRVITYTLSHVVGDGWLFARNIAGHDELAKNSVGDMFARIKNKETGQSIFNVPCFIDYRNVDDDVDPEKECKI